MNKKIIKLIKNIINEEVKSFFLLEAEDEDDFPEPVLPKDKLSNDETEDNVGGDNLDAPDIENETNDENPLPSVSDDAGGDLGAPGGSSFGGGGLGGGDLGAETETEDNSTDINVDVAGEEEEEEEEEDIITPENPEEEILNKAKKMLEITNEPQLIVNQIKNYIQEYYDDIEDATSIIKALYDTQNKILIEVAKRLLLFLKGQ